MGLFGDIVGGIGKFVGGFLGIPTAPAPRPVVGAPMVAPPPAPGVLSTVGTALGQASGLITRATLAGPLISGVAAGARLATTAAGVLFDPSTGQPVSGVMGRGRGNGRFFRQTTVQTFDLVTGQIVRQQVFDGAPFLMNKEVRQLSAVAKKVRKANAKIPTKTRKASALSELRDATVQQALQSVRVHHGHALCPPS